jgi:hypothetical protein
MMYGSHNGSHSGSSSHRGSHSGSSGGTSSTGRHTPVAYSVGWAPNSPSLSITLLIPKRRELQRLQPGSVTPSNHRNSPFKRIDSSTATAGSPDADSGEFEQHILRVPLQYLLTLSAQTYAKSQQHKQQQPPSSSSSSSSQPPPPDTVAPWLDRPTLRARLASGGRGIGLEAQHLFQATAAIEESAARLPEWLPEDVAKVMGTINLMDGTAVFVAHVATAIAIPRAVAPSPPTMLGFGGGSHHHSQQQQQQQQHHPPPHVPLAPPTGPKPGTWAAAAAGSATPRPAA